MPQGTPVVFAGGRLSFATGKDAKTFATSVWDTLDKVRERVADMVLVHGGDGKGADRLAASWAERRMVAQIAFRLDSRLGARAGFKRNELRSFVVSFSAGFIRIQRATRNRPGLPSR